MIKIISAGIYTSFQDRGRFQFTNYGVPISGAMDQYLFELANHLVGNESNEAVLEMTLKGPKLRFKHSAVIAITAVEAVAVLNTQRIDLNHQQKVEKGDILELKIIKSRAYLSVRGGFIAEDSLGSKSQYKNITTRAKLSKGDELAFDISLQTYHSKHAALQMKMSAYASEVLHVFTLPEYNLLNSVQKQKLAQERFSITYQSNRMAYQLEGRIPNELKGIRSKPVMPGTVQLTPEGKLMALMRDAQVTGGYPRIFQLSESSINRLAQKTPGSKIKFKIINSH